VIVPQWRRIGSGFDGSTQDGAQGDRFSHLVTVTLKTAEIRCWLSQHDKSKRNPRWEFGLVCSAQALNPQPKEIPPMKAFLIIAAVLVVPACAEAQGPKSCEELKTEIAAKLDAKGVKSYSLDIVAKDADVTDGKVVGTCEGGAKKIVYRKTAAPAAAPAKDPSTP
jgi:hypothetical protein